MWQAHKGSHLGTDMGIAKGSKWGPASACWTALAQQAAEPACMQRLAVQLLQRDPAAPVDGPALTASIHALCAGGRFKHAEALLRDYLVAEPGTFDLGSWLTVHQLEHAVCCSLMD